MALYGPKELTIAINTAVSEVLEFVPQKHYSNMNLYVSTNGWTTAELGVQVSPDGTTWVQLMESTSAEFGLGSAAADKLYKIANVPPFRHLRFFSHNNGSAVNQAAARTLKVYTEIVE